MRQFVMCLTLTLIVLLSPLSAHAAEEQVAAHGILDRWNESLSMLRHCAFEEEVLTTSPVLDKALKAWHCRTLRVHRDRSGRVEAVIRSWRPSLTPDVDKDSTKTALRHVIVDLDAHPYAVMSLTSSRRLQGELRELQVAKDPETHKGTSLSELDGYLVNLDQVAPAILLSEESKPTLLEHMELVGDARCYVVEAESAYGHIKVWIDPSCGHGLRRAEFRAREGDKINDRYTYPTSFPLMLKQGKGARPYKVIGLLKSLDNTTFERVGDQWVPSSARVLTVYTLPDGREVESVKEIRRWNIDLDPDFEKLGAFKMEIPEGIPVFSAGMGGVRHVWRDGKPVPLVDGEDVSALDKAIGSLQRPSTQPGK
jgi:hypothetical protein